MTATTPKPRPKLPRFEKFPDTLPVKLPTDAGDRSTLEWTERLRDWAEDRGFLLTVKGMMKFCDIAGKEEKLPATDVDDLKKQVTKLYSAESSATPVSPEPKKETTTVTTTTKDTPAAKKGAAPAKKNGTPPAKTNPKKPVAKKAAAKPSSNGHAAPKKPVAKKVADETQTLYEGKVKGLDVRVDQSASNRFRATANGFAFRKLAGWLGYNNWTIAQVRELLTSLVAKWKAGADYVKEMLDEGHVGSGAKANKQGKYVFGYLPDVDSATAKLLKAAKPK